MCSDVSVHAGVGRGGTGHSGEDGCCECEIVYVRTREKTRGQEAKEVMLQVKYIMYMFVFVCERRPTSQSLLPLSPCLLHHPLLLSSLVFSGVRSECVEECEELVCGV